MGRLRIGIAALTVMTLAATAQAEPLVPAGTGWRYLDNGSNLGTSWRDIGFDDFSWPGGPAQLGYGDGDEATIVSFGPDPLNKPITTYFRRAFWVTSPGVYAGLELRSLRDDGVVVYLNGTEIFRSNMPAGAIAFDTLATTAVSGADESAWTITTVSPSLLVAGTNVIAAEIHQSSPSSSDISFDLALHGGLSSQPVEFAWAGALTPTSIRVNAKASFDTANVRLLVSEHPDLSQARVSPPFSAITATNNRVVSIPMRGLAAATTYYWGVEVNGVIDPSPKGRLTTPIASPSSFTFALGSCAATGSNDSVFDAIRNYQPAFFLHMGDFHYEDIAGNDPNLFRAAYDAVFAAPKQAALYRSAPVTYMWDDHDYGPNNGDATTPSRLASRLTYQEYVPHYPLVAGSGDVAIYQAFSIGRVRFIVTDSRSERTPYLDPDSPAKSMLGTAQKQWLQQELLAANGIYPVIVWVNTLPWIGVDGDDGWYAYTFERREIGDFIKDNGIQGLFMLSGDAHMLAIDDGTNSDYATGGGGGFPVMHAAALDRDGSVKGGPYSEGAFPGGGQFGLMTIQDDGVSPVCVMWSGRNRFDAEIVGWSTCAGTAPPPDTDLDGVNDTADCSFADAGVWAAPGTVAGLRVDHGPGASVELSWTSQDGVAGPATSYDLVRGSLVELRVDGDFHRAQCMATGVGDSPFEDASNPPAPGEGEYYLVRARSACGVSGYGHASASDPRFGLVGDIPCLLP